jgi:hypothetical protein
MIYTMIIIFQLNYLFNKLCRGDINHSLVYRI